MIVRIGIAQVPKELEVDLGDDGDPAAVKEIVTAAMAQDSGMLWLTDKKGRQIGVPSGRLGYVEVGAADSGPRIGFGA